MKWAISFTDTMHDSNSHEFEEMVDPITCTPNEEPEENIVEIDETFFGERIQCHHCLLMVDFFSTESWFCCNFWRQTTPSRDKVDSPVVVIDSPPGKEDNSSESSCV